MKNEYEDGEIDVLGSDRDRFGGRGGDNRQNSITLAQFRKGQFNNSSGRNSPDSVGSGGDESKKCCTG